MKSVIQQQSVLFILLMEENLHHFILSVPIMMIFIFEPIPSPKTTDQNVSIVTSIHFTIPPPVTSLRVHLRHCIFRELVAIPGSQFSDTESRDE